MNTILLVEDKAELREMLTHALRRMGYEVTATAGVAEARTALQQQAYSAVLSDLKLPVGSGMDVLASALEADLNTPVVMMTAYGTIAEAVAAMREGAYDFIQKPIDLDHLRHLLGRAIERRQLLRENLVLKEEHARCYGLPHIIGEHPSIQAAARELQRVAVSDTTVLLLGESGTGKELFARAIHQLSARTGKPFVALNCAALPDTLVENELFGHEKGAFTGADRRAVGKFELANSGTIFLDEVGELAAPAQSKLLRVLEEHVVERLGGSSAVRVDVRVIAAANRDLEAAVATKEFRRDLYFRLAVCPIRIPPLRERGDDVLLIAEHFLERFRRELKKPRLKLASDALEALRAHRWPGNVRELQNVIERAALLNDGELHAADLALAANVRLAAEAAGVQLEGSLPDVTSRAVESVERAKIEATLRECRWNKAVSAQRLGISYKTLLTKIHAYGLD